MPLQPLVLPASPSGARPGHLATVLLGRQRRSPSSTQYMKTEQLLPMECFSKLFSCLNFYGRRWYLRYNDFHYYRHQQYSFSVITIFYKQYCLIFDSCKMCILYKKLFIIIQNVAQRSSCIPFSCANRYWCELKQFIFVTFNLHNMIKLRSRKCLPK